MVWEQTQCSICFRYVILVATRNPALETFTNAMLLALPLIAATLIWTSVQFFRTWRNTRSSKSGS